MTVAVTLCDRSSVNQDLKSFGAELRQLWAVCQTLCCPGTNKHLAFARPAKLYEGDIMVVWPSLGFCCCCGSLVNGYHLRW